MSILKYIQYSIPILLVFTSCNNTISSKIPHRYVKNIVKNLPYLAPVILGKYEDNATVRVDNLSDQLLKTTLENLDVEIFKVIFKYDTTNRTKYQLQFVDPTKPDSMIVFAKYKDLQKFSLSSWDASFQVNYYFGVVKPQLKNYQDEFKNVNRKINDSVYFERSNYPHR